MKRATECPIQSSWWGKLIVLIMIFILIQVSEYSVLSSPKLVLCLFVIITLSVPFFKTLILLTVILQFFSCQLWDFGWTSRQCHWVDDFLYSRHLFAWKCVGIITRNYLLITPGNSREKMKMRRGKLTPSCHVLDVFFGDCRGGEGENKSCSVVSVLTSH